MCIDKMSKFSSLISSVCFIGFLSILNPYLVISVKGLDRRTKYGCEGTTLKIECEEGSVINLVRANFGRFSISICNEGGNTDWSVNCMEPRTLRVINARCEGKPHCTIPVDSTIFGDPCPGTNKYVEVHYTCKAHKQFSNTGNSATTNKPLPPWLLALDATPSSASTTTTEATTKAAISTENSVSTVTSFIPDITEGKRTVPNPLHKNHKSNQSQDKGIETTEKLLREESTSDINGIVVEEHIVQDNPFNNYDEDETEDDSETNDFPEQIHILEEIVDHCSPRSERNLFWNWTRAGADAIQLCPQGSSGFARWTCDSNGEWESSSPNLGDCQSLWLNRMEDRLGKQSDSKDRQPISEIALELSGATETRPLYGGDFLIAAKIAQSLAHRTRQELYVMQSQEDKETLVAVLLQSVMKATSNLIDLDRNGAWRDLDYKQRSLSATSLMLALEDSAILLAETVNNEKRLTEMTNNILSSVRIMRARGVTSQIFPEADTMISETGNSKVVVPTQALLSNSVNGAIRLVFFFYDHLEEILSYDRQHFVNSKVVGVVLSKGRYLDLEEDSAVKFTLKHLDTSSDVKNPSCAVWSYSERRWKIDDTCNVLDTNSTHTSCSCKKIANYAIVSERETEFGGSGTPKNITQENTENSNFTALVACAVALMVCLILAVIAVIVMKRCDFKSRFMHSFLSGKESMCTKAVGGIPACFHCKKSESQNSCGSTGGLYPALTSSPTSTTMSSGSPPNSSNYLVQILEQQQNTLQNLKKQQQHNTMGYNLPQKAMPQTMANPTLNPNNLRAGSIYQVTAPRNVLQRQQLDGSTLHTIGDGGAFRPVTPSYNHHIYMEIDPVYAHAAANMSDNEGLSAQNANFSAPMHCYSHSDIQLSDISDDDLRLRGTGCFASASSGGSSANSRICNQYAEERPLIRTGTAGNSMIRQTAIPTQEEVDYYTRQCMTSQRNFLRLGMPLQVATLSAAAARGHNVQNSRFVGHNHQQPQTMFGDTTTPVAVSTQDGEQYVSLQIDQHKVY